jgi:hypothetical protein
MDDLFMDSSEFLLYLSHLMNTTFKHENWQTCGSNTSCLEKDARQISQLNCQGVWDIRNISSQKYIRWVYKERLVEQMICRGALRLAATLQYALRTTVPAN